MKDDLKIRTRRCDEKDKERAKEILKFVGNKNWSFEETYMAVCVFKFALKGMFEEEGMECFDVEMSGEN